MALPYWVISSNLVRMIASCCILSSNPPSASLSYFLSFLSGLNGPPADFGRVRRYPPVGGNLYIFNAASVFVVDQCIGEHKGSLFV